MFEATGLSGAGSGKIGGDGVAGGESNTGIVDTRLVDTVKAMKIGLTVEIGRSELSNCGMFCLFVSMAGRLLERVASLSFSSRL